MVHVEDQTVFLASSPFVGLIDSVEESVVVYFGVVVDTFVVDMDVVVGRPND